MQNSLISILLPVRNAAEYLQDCIESIIDQSETLWELIVIEDHSSDESFEILKKYAQYDQRIKVFRNNGKGIIPALRLALSNSTGNLITRMDADDIMMPSKLEKLKTLLLLSGPGHLTTGLVEYFSENELGGGYLRYQEWLNKLSHQEANYQDIYKECVIPSPCWMTFRKDLEICGAFDSDIYPEDYDLSFRFYKNGIKVKTAKEILHRWRDYPQRTSRNDPNYANIHFFKLKMKYFLELDYNSQRPLVLWGAGKKGKQLARILNIHNIPFKWITDNLKKIGKDIDNIRVESVESHKNWIDSQLIIAIAIPEVQNHIHTELKKYNLKASEDYFFFC